MNRRLRIGLDLDNVINNLAETLIEVYNKESGDNLKLEQITKYKIDNFTKPGYKISDYFKDPALWMRVLPIYQSQEYIKILNDDYDLRIISASHLGDMPTKYRWIKTYFPFIKREQIWTVFDKDWVNVDVLVDDCLDNLTGRYEKIVLDYPWNQTNDKNIHRAYSFADVFKIIKEIDDKLKSANTSKEWTYKRVSE